MQTAPFIFQPCQEKSREIISLKSPAISRLSRAALDAVAARGGSAAQTVKHLQEHCSLKLLGKMTECY